MTLNGIRAVLADDVPQLLELVGAQVVHQGNILPGDLETPFRVGGDPALILALGSSEHSAVAIRGAATARPTDVQEERAVLELRGKAVAR